MRNVPFLFAALSTLALAACGGAAHYAPEAPASDVSGTPAMEPEAVAQAGAPAGLAGADMAKTAEEAPASPGAAPMAAPPAQPAAEPMAAAPPPPRAAEGRATASKPAARPAPTSAVARPAPVPGASPPREVAVASAGVKAGEWDDNANYRDFLGYVRQSERLGIERIDTSQRRFLVVRDSNGDGVPNCKVVVSDPATQKSVTLTTAASGRALLFPKAHGFTGAQLTATSSCLSQNVVARTTIDTSAPDGTAVLEMRALRADASKPVVDVVFVLDTTGSMMEEIEAVKSTLKAVIAQLDENVQIRVGLVEYKDRTDNVVTRVFPLTSDLRALSSRIAGVSAEGGGDTPEDVNAGLSVAVGQMAWSDKAVARLAFLIADAPPHLDYADGVSYATSAKRAAEKGIKVFTVAASGMDSLGQAVFRQVAQLTGGTSLFVLRGGAGAQSTGGGDPRSSCGGTHENFTSGNLDQLITRKIALEVTSLRADPTRIAGLGQDENAKPCNQRVLVVAR